MTVLVARLTICALLCYDRCDLRCSFIGAPQVFNDYEEHDSWLTFHEIWFARMGTSKICAVGEPLLRRNISELAARLSQIDGVRMLLRLAPMRPS